MFTLLCITCCVACVKTQQADLVVHNATIHTLDPTSSTAQAMAVREGRIVDIGPEREIMNRYRAAQTFDARKMHVYPGFSDAHAHFSGYARNKAELNLYGVESPEALVAMAQAFAKNSSREWLVGRGWDQNLWPLKEFPDKALLDSVFPDRPVLLTRVDGHAALANSAALRKAGITASTAVPGGKVMLNARGEPNGMLIDLAVNRVSRFIPKLSHTELLPLLREAQQECFSVGLTSVSDLGLSVREVDMLDSLYQEGQLSIRLYASLRPDDHSMERMRKGPHITDRFSVRSVKLYADGALGSRGALLKAPYSDEPDNYGLLLMPTDELKRWAEACYDYGFQLNTHAIGDSAVALVLSTYASQLKDMNDLRWRVEHAQVVSPDDLRYFRDYAIIPSVQPVHASSDGPWAAERLGDERISHAYAYESLRSALGWLPLGTDFPVEGISPLENIYAAVFRRPFGKLSQEPFQPQEALSPEHALRGISQWGALAAFTEEHLGTLESGKWADFVVLNRDILRLPEEEFTKVKVVATFLEGRQVH